MNDVLPLINALAWPTALVALALVFRREIGQTSGRLGRVKYRDLELTFRDDLRQAEALSRALPVVATPGGAALPTPGRPLLEAGAGEGPSLGGSMIVPATPGDGQGKPKGRVPSDVMSPREAILAAWWDLGQSLIQAATKLGDRRSPTPERADDAFRFLAARGWLGPEEVQLYEGLSRLRDQVDRLDGASIGLEESRRFIGLASKLTARVVSRG